MSSLAETVPQTGFFDAGNSLELYYQRWVGEQPPEAVVLLVHGLGEHCNRYQALAEVLVAENVAVCGLDLPGHGKSPGKAAHIERFEDYAKAALSFNQQIKTWFPDVPIFLLGHSMGGLVSAQILLKNQQLFAGCVLSGPAIMSPLEPGRIQIALVTLLSRLFPTAGALQLDATGVSRDANVVKDYVDDPLVHHGKASARLVREMFSTMNAVQDGAGTIELPILLLHGAADVMTSAKGSEFLYQNVGSSDKQLEVFPELFHEIFNEPEGPEIHAQVCKWIKDRV